MSRSLSGGSRMTPIKSDRSTTSSRRARRISFASTVCAVLGSVAVSFGLSVREARAELTPGQRQQVVLADAADLENFGLVVAMDGDTAVVGTPNDDTPTGTDGGAAYVFVRNAAGQWQQRQRLTASNSLANDHFGEAVAISGRNLVVGAPGRNSAAGAVYAFR